MKNYKQEGDRLEIVESALVHVDTSVATDGFVNSGDPVVVGAICGVAVTDAAASTDVIAIKCKGVFNLNVQAKNAGGDSAVALGDTIYIDGATGVLNKVATKTPFGVALGAVASGATDKYVDVRLFE